MRLGQTSIVHFLSHIGTTVLGAIATIYFARVLGASTLGKYYLIIAFLAWMKIAGNLGMETALTKRISEGEEPGAYISSGLLAQTGLFLVVAVAILLARPWVEQYVGVEIIEGMVALLFVQLAFTFVSAVLRGQHLVHVSAALRPFERLLRTGFQLALIYVGFEVLGLVVGYVLSAAIATVVGGAMISLRFARPRIEHFRALFDFARYSWLGQLMGNSFNSVDTIVLGVFVTSTLIGIYEISWNVASILAVFGASIVQSLFPEMSKLASTEGKTAVSDLAEKALAFAGVFTIPGLVGTVLIGDLVLRIYGTEFQRGHTILIILVFARLLFAYQSQFANTLNAIDRPDVTFQINAAFIGLNLLLNVVLIWSYGWIGAAVATSLSAGVALVISYYLTHRVMPVGIPYREVGNQLAAAGGMAVVVYTLRALLPDSNVNLLLYILAGATLYFALLFGISQLFRETVLSNVSRETLPL